MLNSYCCDPRLRHGGSRHPTQPVTDADFEEFERVLADQLSEPTLTRLTRLIRARSNVDDNDPRYDVVLKRVFNLP
jgi:hypothetical protein